MLGLFCVLIDTSTNESTLNPLHDQSWKEIKTRVFCLLTVSMVTSFIYGFQMHIKVS
jgi:hypothetical protein